MSRTLVTRLVGHAAVLVACASPLLAQEAPAPARPARTPLKQALGTLQPAPVWANFYELTRIPRASGHEQAVSRFVAAFGRTLGLETTVDSVGNVLIRKPATPGMEAREPVALQAHLDLVPEKSAGKVFAFDKDGVEAFLEDGWVKADGTTLGADDGIGVAAMMAILQSRDLRHGPLEALFTVDEEGAATGVLGLQPGTLKSRLLINLDWEREGEFGIGSAGGVDVNVNAVYAEDPVPAGMRAYTVRIDALRGGHSGIEIDKGRGNAATLLARLLWSSAPRYGVRITSLASGSRNNAIPANATALVLVPASQAAAFETYVETFDRTVQQELAVSDPAVRVRVVPAAPPGAMMNSVSHRALIGALYAGPNGVIRMSDAVPGLVETSSNIGVVTAEGGAFRVAIRVRSAVDSARDDLAERLIALFQLAGAADTVAPADSVDVAWRPNPRSPILALMKDAYRSRFGTDPLAIAVHAGLEASGIGAKHPKMDMIAIGPTILDVHTPNERIEVASVGRLYDLLTETFTRIPERAQ